MARYMRRQPQTDQHSNLSPPAVIGAGIYFRGIQVYTTQPVHRNEGGADRRSPYSRLRPPIVVNPAVVQIFFGPNTNYWVAVKSKENTALIRRQAYSFLRKPIIPPLAPPVRVTLAKIKPPPTISRLAPPTVVGLAVEIYGPKTSLAPQSRRPGVASLYHPAVIAQAQGPQGGVMLVFAPKPRTRTISKLQPPASVAAVTEVFYGPQTTLVRNRPRPVESRLFSPVIPPLAEPTRITLAPQRRGKTTSFLSPPALADSFAGPNTNLTYSRRGAPHSFLRGLPTGALDVYEGPQTHLTYSSRGTPKPLLREPPFFLAPFAPITVHLARNKPQPTQASVEPPTVVQDRALLFFGPATSLAYSRRGKPLPALQPPAVVGAGRFFRGILVSLAPPRFPTPKSLLIPPTVVGKQPFRGILTSLAPSRFPKPTSTLHPAIIPPLAAPTAVHLAYSRRGRPIWFLREPVIPPLARPVAISLAPQAVRPGRGVLSPPTVVFSPPFRPILVSLTRNAPRPTVALVKPPTVVKQPPFRPITVHLAYSLRGRPTYFLKRPTVVTEAFQAAPITVWLAYSVRGRPIHFLKPPTTLAPPVPGDVCGFDVVEFFVCGEDLPNDQAVYGVTTASGDTISGGDTPRTDRVSGYDFTDAAVTGEDA